MPFAGNGRRAFGAEAAPGVCVGVTAPGAVPAVDLDADMGIAMTASPPSTEKFVRTSGPLSWCSTKKNPPLWVTRSLVSVNVSGCAKHGYCNKKTREREGHTHTHLSGDFVVLGGGKLLGHVRPDVVFLGVVV